MIKINHNYMNDTTVNHCRKHQNDEHQKVKKNRLKYTIQKCLKNSFSQGK